MTILVKGIGAFKNSYWEGLVSGELILFVYVLILACLLSRKLHCILLTLSNSHSNISTRCWRLQISQCSSSRLF